MTARIYILAAESKHPLGLVAQKQPGDAARAATTNMFTFAEFVDLGEAGLRRLANELATGIGRPDLADGGGQ